MIWALTVVWRVVLGLVSMLYVPVLAGVMIGAVVLVLRADVWPVSVWVAAAPVLYAAWMLAFLTMSAIEFQIIGRLWPKPRRLDNDESRLTLPAAMLIHTSQRYDLVHALPFVTNLLRIPVLQELVLLSYAPRATVGRDVLIYGRVYDPEYTFLGDRVTVGGGSALAAHAFISRGGGRSSYVTAPVRVEHDATIGGESRVAMGVTIGANSVVEPGAIVDPFTTIPPNQVWGGAPARFRRTIGASDDGRDPEGEAPTLAASHGEHHEAARHLIAEALDIPLADVSAMTAYGETAGWDSLGQLVIATLAQERHGSTLSPDDVYRIRTVADVERLIAGQPLPRVEVEPADDRVPPLDIALSEPELLPLLDRATATAALAASDGSVDAMAPRRLRIVIASTFTAQPLVPSLRVWARAFGTAVDVQVAPFGQVEQALLSPSGAFGAAPTDALRVVLARAEDFAEDAEGRQARASAILDAIAAYTANRGTLVVGTLPPPLRDVTDTERSTLERLRAEWRARLESMTGVELVDVARVIERLGTLVAADAASETVLRMPFSPVACRDLGIELARAVRRRTTPPRKVVALDCDGTLWRGVVGEDGAGGVGVSADGTDRAFQQLQLHLRELKQRGVLLTLVSRNEEADVWRVFDDHPGMILTRQDIAAWRIAWRPKSELIAELASDLGFSLDAFVFLDDDRAVRREVQANARGVLVVPLSDNPLERSDTVARLWCFDGNRPTDVDRDRARMAHEERGRQEFLRTTDMGTYLRDLDLVVSIRRASDAEVARVAQLTQRTNQFNTSLIRRTVDEVRELSRRAEVLALSARDRFGDYGLVGVAVVEADGLAATETAVMESLLMSCRALGRGVEDALLHVVAVRVRSQGASRLAARVEAGPRNQPALEFLQKRGFRPDGPGLVAIDLDVPLEAPSHIRVELGDPVVA